MFYASNLVSTYHLNVLKFLRVSVPVEHIYIIVEQHKMYHIAQSPTPRCISKVLWSRSNLDRLRFRLPAPSSAPANKIFVTQVQVKSAVLKTKVNIFFFSGPFLFFLSMCINCRNVTKFYKNNRYFASTVPLSQTVTAWSRSFFTDSS